MRCHNTHLQGLKPCPFCVCYKCGGDAYIQAKHKPCKKIKIQVASGYGYRGKYKKFKKFKGYKGFKKGFKKFKLKKFF